ncbi:MAG TPA: MarR family winged helix-turn-helix transcriptional regulator [Chloroflexia bacterium]
MSTPSGKSDSKRAQLLAAAMAASRESSTTAVFFHTALAEQVGLGATEAKTLFILGSRGPLTAGEIAKETGLTTASVTSLLDRLESKGCVRRVRDTRDRRRVIVEPNESWLTELAGVFDTLQEAFAPLLEVYTNEELAAIADFLTRAARLSRTAIAEGTLRKPAAQ